MLVIGPSWHPVSAEDDSGGGIIEWVEDVLGLGGDEPKIIDGCPAPSNDTVSVVVVSPEDNDPSSTPTATTTAPTPAPTDFNCKNFHFDCCSCLANDECYWCPTDGLCFNSAKFERRESKQEIRWDNLYPERMHGCRTPEDFTQTTCTRPENFFKDPVYSAQDWIFSAINVVPVWKRGYFGRGVRVRIVDSGIETTHPEFEGRIDFDASCPNGTAESLPESQGMTVASLVGAAGNNSNCGVGIAPEVTLSSCNFNKFDRVVSLDYKLDSFDISQNSWAFEGCGKQSSKLYHDNVRRNLQTDNATVTTTFRQCPFQHKPFPGYLIFPCDNCNFTDTDELLGENCTTAVVNHCGYFAKQDRKACMEFLDVLLLAAEPTSQGECHFGNLNNASLEVLTRGITEGRDGKGIIYVFAAGNEFATGDDTNFQSFGANTRFTIPVAATGKPGRVSAFSTPGASVFVTAPGGDHQQSVTRVVAATNGGRCQDMAEGTSFAAPVVSGIVALMLEANPDLTWRDVQHILATTSQYIPDVNETFAKNDAGYLHSNRYGFGIANADAAVNMSETWITVPPEQSLVGEGEGPVVIPDNRGNSTTLPLFIDRGITPFFTETVYLYVKVNHSSRGHLRIHLRSPKGMRSVMSPGERPESRQVGWMKFTSVKNWGEDPHGQWNITIIDTTPGTVNDCISYDDYSYPFGDADETQITCAANKEISFFCSNGAVDPEGLVASLCNDSNDEEACDRLDRFTKTKFNGRTGVEACCECGGGFHPSELPETVARWKLVVYGHEKAQGFFSRSQQTIIDGGNDDRMFSHNGRPGDIELGKWDGRGVVQAGDRFQNPHKDTIQSRVRAKGEILQVEAQARAEVLTNGGTGGGLRNRQ